MSKAATIFHAGRMLSEAELQPPHVACPLCGSGEDRAFACKIDKRVSFLRCSQCHGISANRMPTPAALDGYYAQYYSDNQSQKITFAKPERIGKLLLRHTDVSSAKPQHFRILDIGGGDGLISITTAELIQKRFGADTTVEIIVVDYVDSNSQQCTEGIELKFEHDLDALHHREDGKYDLIIGSAVFEHIPEFNKAWSRTVDLCAPAGLIYVRTPYMVPFKKLLKNLDLTYPAHVHDLGAKFWATIPDRHTQLSIIEAGPSFIETSWSENTERSAIAATLKAPAHFMAQLGLPALWPFYGGWQSLYRKIK